MPKIKWFSTVTCAIECGVLGASMRVTLDTRARNGPNELSLGLRQ